MKAIVKKAHKSDILIPLKAVKGEIIQGEKRVTEWEGWLYCTNSEGIKAWVPRAYLEKLKEENSYQFNRFYNSFEITISKGKQVEIKELESGWALVFTEDGEEGWIPLKNLDIKKECQ